MNLLTILSLKPFYMRKLYVRTLPRNIHGLQIKDVYLLFSYLTRLFYVLLLLLLLFQLKMHLNLQPRPSFIQGCLKARYGELEPISTFGKNERTQIRARNWV